MQCIDCSQHFVATIVQQRSVFGRTCTWHICFECKDRYERETEAIKFDLARKALGKTPAPPTQRAKRASQVPQQGSLA